MRTFISLYNKMDRWVGKVALVTGTSAGMGEAIAQKLVEQGIQVVGMARRRDRLEDLEKKLSSKKGKFYACPGDISKEEDILKTFAWIKDNVGPVSILINNAGVSREGSLSDSPTRDWADILNINVLAPCIVSREAIRQMKENHIDGHIVNINSILGHKIVNMPDYNLYPASKHAVKALTETLRLELAREGSKIKVTSLSPGGVKTEMMTKFMENRTPEELEAMKSKPLLEAEDIANATVYVLSTPKNVQITELIIQPVGEMC